MRNIVLVTIDSIRADHCSFDGYGKETTPNLDQLAQEGVEFENAIAPGTRTPESMPAIFTGSHPNEHIDKFDTRMRVKTHLNRIQTIPERLSGLGYTTAGFTPNPFTSRYYGFDAGFDEYHDFLSDDPLSSNLRSRIVTRWIKDETVAGARFLINMFGFGDISMTWESYYESVLNWTQKAEEPYFLWLFLLEPHWPYIPPRRYRKHSLSSMYRANWQRAPASSTTPTPAYADILSDLYDNSIQHADELFERLDSDLPGSPIIVVHGDHGEEFGEHENFDHSQLYEETIRVPFVIGNINEAHSISSPTSLAAMPNIICSLARDDNWWMDSSTEYAIARKNRNQIAVRGSRWKHINHKKPELYDLHIDPNEKNSVIDTKPEVAEALQRYASHSQEILAERERISTAVSDISSTQPL